MPPNTRIARNGKDVPRQFLSAPNGQDVMVTAGGSPAERNPVDEGMQDQINGLQNATTVREWYPGHFTSFSQAGDGLLSTASASSDDPKFALIILNRPITLELDDFRKLWNSCTVNSSYSRSSF